MSRRSSWERSVTIADGDGLSVIREEKTSAFVSKDDVSFKTESIYSGKPGSVTGTKYGDADLEALFAEREAQLRAEFDNELKTQLGMLRERFDFVLEHEQVRSCYMLREAHRERKEKIQALQTQLECKNLTGLMYVMCSERRKAKLEKMRIISEYTKYILTLQDILTEGQRLILHLSRGYKTAARVDHEWRQKMKSIIKEFQEYVYHFAGGTPESNQYVFDVPALLRTKASIVDDPEEDPCTCEEDGEEETVVDEDGVKEDKRWWELLDSPCKPFVVFGDMAEFRPPQRRQVVASANETLKSAPPKWKDYVFNEMLLKSDCPRAEVIKDEYPKHLPGDKWECQGHVDNDSSDSSRFDGRRMTTNSNEMRNMGSILKIITSSGLLPPKTNLLAARDSMEIASSTKIRGKKSGCDVKKMSICIARTRSSSMQYLPKEFMPGKSNDIKEFKPIVRDQQRLSDETYDEAEPTGVTKNGLDSIQDSLLVIPSHKADTDHKIHYEKICPIDKCQRMQVDSFMRSLPAYMRSSPYMLFEQTFAEYETCSPEQLQILKHRLEQKQKRHAPEEEDRASEPDFEKAVNGVGVQTSDELITGLPLCSCMGPYPSAASSTARVFRVEDLIPMKEALDEITKECFYNQNIMFDRFKVVGQESKHSYSKETKGKDEFKKQRVQEIKNILRKHPSMLDLFQPNPQC
ncbi:uncharacterized protein LOC134801109 [Cydia splendana]|uniref:uncharacterized protein LOC134801109 n=1 Tax=Cydia splendana TaxID=1100963 RepID=UPI0028F4B14D